MTDSQSDLDLHEESPSYPFPIYSWLAVIVVIAVILNPSFFFPKPAQAENAPAEEKPAPAVVEPLALETKLVKFSWGLQIFGNSEPSKLMEQLKTLEEKGSQQKLAVALVEAVVIGPQAARKSLDAMAEPVKGTSLEKSLAIVQDWVKRSENDPQASIDDPSREELAGQLGWFASIPGNGPVPKKDPKAWFDDTDSFYGAMVRYALRGTVLTFFAICAFLAGLGLFFYFIVMASREQLGPGLAYFADGQALSAVMMQTFAIWFVGYFALSLLVGGIIAPRVGLSRLAAGILVQVLSLGAALWPLMRGVPLPVMLAHIGLGKEVGSPREIAFGIMAAIGFWPVLIVLTLITVVLAQGLPEAEQPNHPLGPLLMRATRTEWILAFIAAAILAPIVEEIFFRGFLYRHLRETAHGAGPGLDVLLSIGISSTIFAMIHPQGVLGMPPLVGLGSLFALLRETRDNLTASIAAHSFNNSMAILLISFLI